MASPAPAAQDLDRDLRCGCTGRCSSAADSSSAPTSCSSRGSSAGRRTWDRAGGGRRRSRRGDARRRLHVLHVPRPQPHTRPRRADGAALRGALRQARRAHGRQGRLDAHDQRRARHHGLVRDRRRPPADRGRGGVVGPVPRVGPGRGLLLRRRDDEHRRVPRGAQPGRGLEGAGRLRVREQPVHGVHRDRRRHGRRAAGRGPRIRLRPGAHRRRRQRRRGRVRDGAPGDRAGARGRGPVADRGGDVSPWRPLARRSRHVPAGGGGQGLAGARPDPGAARAAARRGGRRRRAGADRERGEMAVAAAEEVAREATEPDPGVGDDRVWSDGGSSWRS